MHSLCFLMKTRLRHPHLPPGQRQMPFYTQSHFAKNQSARTLGKLQRTDRPPAPWQGILTLRGSGRVVSCVAQGGCACCASSESLWVAGWDGMRAQGGCACCAFLGSLLGEIFRKVLTYWKGHYILEAYQILHIFSMPFGRRFHFDEELNNGIACQMQLQIL